MPLSWCGSMVACHVSRPHKKMFRRNVNVLFTRWTIPWPAIFGHRHMYIETYCKARSKQKNDGQFWVGNPSGERGYSHQKTLRSAVDGIHRLPASAQRGSTNGISPCILLSVTSVRTRWVITNTQAARFASNEWSML